MLLIILLLLIIAAWALKELGKADDKVADLTAHAINQAGEQTRDESEPLTLEEFREAAFGSGPIKFALLHQAHQDYLAGKLSVEDAADIAPYLA